MRKQTKLVAVLSAAALLAVGASMTSFAAKGWTEENGSWYYYSTEDDYVTNDWKKSGNNWFYLGEDGAMMTDSLIEDGNYVYYVNANGAMVTNSWVAVEPGEDDYDEYAPDHYWYYFGSNGKAYKASESSNGLSIKTINGKKYGFDRDSRMVYGFVQEDGTKNQDENPFEGAMYYFGSSDDGAMHTDWLQYTDGSDLSSDLAGKEYADMDEMWFYFKPSTGKMVKGENEIKTQTVRGQKYGFDEKGVMVYGWNGTSSDSAATESKYFSDQYDGHLKKKTWIYAVPTAEMDAVTGASDFADDTSRWFYADATGTTVKNQIKSINGKKYLFDEVGVMKTGLQWVADGKVVDGDKDESAQIIAGVAGANLYYFSNSADDGSMKTGKNIKIELDDDTFTFAFKKTGQAYDYTADGLVDNKIYQNGILYKADSDIKYVAYPKDEKDDAEYLVGTSGTVVGKKKYVKDGDENWWAVDSEDNVKFFDGNDEYAKDKARCFAQGKNRYNTETKKCE